MFFLMLNVVIILNFVIAILGNTFSTFQPQKNGLYLCVLISQFPTLEWDEQYGCIACSQIPINILATALYPLMYISTYDDDCPCFELDTFKVNRIITYVLFIPNAIQFTVFFFLYNLIVTPIAYLNLFFFLLGSIFKQKTSGTKL